MRHRPFRFSASSLVVVVALVCLAVGCSSATKDGSSSSTSAKKATTATSGSPGCPQGQWPKNFQGTPVGIKDAAQNGVYVWTDLAGLHLRVRDTGDKPAHFNGTVTGSKDLASAKANPADAGAVTLKGNQVTWDIQSSKDLKGFDLAATCQVLELNWAVQTADGPYPAAQIHTGATSMATSSPFIMNRS